MNKESLINFQLQELTKLSQQPKNCETFALETYTVEILINLGLTKEEIFNKISK